MDYNDFPELKDNVIEKMALAYSNKVYTVQALENDSDDDFFSKLSQGIQLGISFLELLLKFSKNIYKIKRVRDKVALALEEQKKELSSVPLNHAQTASQTKWRGMFRPNCNIFLDSEFILLFLLLQQLKKNETSIPREKIVDMMSHHINNIKLVSNLLV